MCARDAAPGDDADAVDAFGRALASVTSDFGRTNLERARIQVKQGRPRDAIATLQPAARGWFLETTNLHMSLTEVHERLARAHELAGAADSAVVHWRRVVVNWASADPPFARRRSHAAERLAALTRRCGVATHLRQFFRAATEADLDRGSKTDIEIGKSEPKKRVTPCGNGIAGID